jgi:hypothetical protein
MRQRTTALHCIFRLRPPPPHRAQSFGNNTGQNFFQSYFEQQLLVSRACQQRAATPAPIKRAVELRWSSWSWGGAGVLAPHQRWHDMHLILRFCFFPDQWRLVCLHTYRRPPFLRELNYMYRSAKVVNTVAVLHTSEKWQKMVLKWPVFNSFFK